MRITCIIGTRPEAIKMAPIVSHLRSSRPGVITRVCVTGQHREMLKQVLDAFGIVPDVDLRLMSRNQSLAKLTSRAIEEVSSYLAQDLPDLVLVQGDTTTAFCSALAAFYLAVPVAHVEAGLRTGDMRAPWPEEANRVLISRLAALHFAPTRASADNLIREGVPDARIYVTGNTVVDALLEVRATIEKRGPDALGLDHRLLDAIGGGQVVLITGHRRENFGPRFESICGAIRELAARFPNVHFVYPVHLNPNVREPVRRLLGPATKGPGANVHLIDPLPYLPFVALMHRSTIILTDSGGMQEEAPSLGKPVLVMRDTTERPEGVEAGCVRLVGADRHRIVEETATLLTNRVRYESMAHVTNPYGDGHAAQRIIKACIAYIGERTDAATSDSASTATLCESGRRSSALS